MHTGHIGLYYGVLHSGLGVSLSWALLLQFNHLAIVKMFSPYPYAVLVTHGRLTILNPAWELYSGVDLLCVLCVLGISLSWALFLPFNYLVIIKVFSPYPQPYW